MVELDEEMNRVLILQGLTPCKNKISKSNTAREGFIFSLGLLMPDKMIVRMVEEKFSLKQIGHIFRVPEKIAEIKKGILVKYNLLKV